MQLSELSLAQASHMLQTRQVSSLELTQATLERIEAVDDKVHAFLTLTADLALEQAKAADQRLAEGGAPALCGVPGGIKDVICTKDVRTSAGSRILESFVPPL